MADRNPMADQKKKESILIWKNIKVKTEKINLIRDYPGPCPLSGCCVPAVQCGG